MVERIVCQKCSKASYTSASEVYGHCPYCGFVFNWRRPDRRVFKRTNKEAPLTLEIHGNILLSAKMVDISKRGVGIIVHNPHFVKKGDQIEMGYNGGDNEKMRDAKVVWAEEGKNCQRVGLLFIK